MQYRAIGKMSSQIGPINSHFSLDLFLPATIQWNKLLSFLTQLGQPAGRSVGRPANLVDQLRRQATSQRHSSFFTQLVITNSHDLGVGTRVIESAECFLPFSVWYFFYFVFLLRSSLLCSLFRRSTVQSVEMQRAKTHQLMKIELVAFFFISRSSRFISFSFFFVL